MPTMNEAQMKAITAGDGPALVLAGAGSGKTRVIVERIVWLIEERGVDPRNILALTFTNRAAAEMKSRIAARLGVERLATWVGTYHSFGLFVLRREMERLGRPKNFTVFDDGDQLSLMKRLVKGLSAGSTKVSPREALSWISRLKQETEEPGDEESLNEEDAVFRELWPKYHHALEKARAVDFDDLLGLPAKLFGEDDEVREKYRRRYTHILVDEYQDTNRVQYLIAKELSGEGGNLFVVGDEDQSIYSWRGADITNILDFEKDFPGAATFRLEQNYRSTKAILAAANAVVACNVERLGKTLWSDQEGGDRVGYCLVADGGAEARWVVDTIAKRGFEPRSTAILYRTNGQARAMEEAFRRKGLAYIVVGGIKFFARKEIKDLLCYLRILINPVDGESLRRIVNIPPRGIGGTTLEEVNSISERRGIPMLEAMREMAEDLAHSARARNAAAAFVALIDTLALKAGSDSVESILEAVLEATGYRDYVQHSDEKDFRARLEVVDEFIASCAEFDERDEGGLEIFLQDLALVSDTEGYSNETPAVALMTCHSAKGLEFDNVFLIGMEEGYLPHGIAAESDEDVEEERRLCYVAMTRARKTLLLSGAETRVVFGEGRDRTPSRFIDEIPEGQLEKVASEEAATRGRARPSAPRAAEGELRMGAKVRHGTFGKGTVMYTSGSGKKLKVRIRFDSGMSRQFMVSAAPLEILEGKRK